MLQVVVLSALVGFQGAAQSLVLRLQLLQGRGRLLGGRLFQQVTAQQFLLALLAALSQFEQLATAAGRMQPVAHLIAPLGGELLLDILVQLQALRGIHQAGVGGADQAAEVACGDAPASMAAGVQIEQMPAGGIEALEREQAQVFR